MSEHLETQTNHLGSIEVQTECKVLFFCVRRSWCRESFWLRLEGISARRQKRRGRQNTRATGQRAANGSGQLLPLLPEIGRLGQHAGRQGNLVRFIFPL